MAIALVIDGGTAGGSNGGTTAAVNATGADLLVACVLSPNSVTPTLADSQSNTWVALTGTDSPFSNQRLKIWYVKNPSVSSTMTVTVGGASSFTQVGWAAFSGSDTSSPFDQENGAASDPAATLAPGSVTPSTNGQLIINAEGHNTSLTGLPLAINVGTIINSQEVGATSGGSGLAYEVQGTAGAINRTWTRANFGSMIARVATFKASGGGGAATWGPLLGLHNNRLVAN